MRGALKMRTRGRSFATARVGSVFALFVAGALALGTEAVGLVSAQASVPEGWTVGQAPAGGLVDGVSCISSTWCMGVGSTGKPTYKTFTAQWDGQNWTPEASPNPTGLAPGLQLVSCSSNTACTAVGNYVNSSDTKRLPLVERWDGVTWTIQTAPHAGANVIPSGLSCPSANVCIAVAGTAGFTRREKLLAERWDGTRWAVMQMPGEGTPKAVSCSSDNACIAVGYPASNTKRPLAERWNGRTWTIQKTATLPRDIYSSQLDAISCPSNSGCTAIGFSQRLCPPTASSCATEPPLAEHWNGVGWKIERIPTPGPAGSYNVFSAVSCTSPTACIAVGSSAATTNPPAPARTLAATGNGARWTIQPSPNPNPGYSDGFSSVSCTASPTVTCLAVGSATSQSGTKVEPLVERYS